jgi:hypothetical protein
VQDLLKLEDQRLRAVVRHRLRQLWAEQCPRWKLVKAIREHVQAALRLPELDVDVLPLTVLDQGRIRLDLIREAVSWLKSKSLPRSCSGKELASRIIELYFPADVRPVGVDGLVIHHGEEDLIAALDAPILVKRLEEDLGPGTCHMLKRRIEGATLGELACESKVAISTIHSRLAKAVELARVQLRPASTSGLVLILINSPLGQVPGAPRALGRRPGSDPVGAVGGIHSVLRGRGGRGGQWDCWLLIEDRVVLPAQASDAPSAAAALRPGRRVGGARRVASAGARRGRSIRGC